jgi:papain like cysteine protease AvrRpt2
MAWWSGLGARSILQTLRAQFPWLFPGSGGLKYTWAYVRGFNVQKQEDLTWCWAAVSLGILHKYNQLQNVSQQCQYVEQALALAQGVCCSQPLDAACTQTQNLTNTLGNNLRFNPPRSAHYDECQAEITNQRPIGVEIGWSGGRGAHYAAIGGVRVPNNFSILILDPQYGPSIQNGNTFPSAYQFGGSWTATYFTQP